MCPFCIATTAAVVAASAPAGGVVAALALKVGRLRSRKKRAQAALPQPAGSPR